MGAHPVLDDANVQAVLAEFADPLDGIFAEFADPPQGVNEAVMSKDGLRTLLRRFGLVPLRLKEDTVPTLMADMGINAISRSAFDECLVHLAQLASRPDVYAGTPVVPIEKGLSELLRVLKRHNIPLEQEELLGGGAKSIYPDRHNTAGGAAAPRSSAPLTEGSQSAAAVNVPSHRPAPIRKPVRPPSGAGRVRPESAKTSPTDDSTTIPADAAELSALRRHIASLEHNLASAEAKLLEHGILVTRVAQTGSVPSDSNTAPSLDFSSVDQLTTGEDHEQTLERFAAMRASVASLAARNTALEAQPPRGGSTAGAVRVAAAASDKPAGASAVETRRAERRELALKEQLSQLQRRNLDLESQLTQARMLRAKEQQAGDRRRDPEYGRQLSSADARPSCARNTTSGQRVGGVSALEHLQLKQRLAAVEMENRQMRKQLEAVERERAAPRGSEAARIGLLDYARTMTFRTVGDDVDGSSSAPAALPKAASALSSATGLEATRMTPMPRGVGSGSRRDLGGEQAWPSHSQWCDDVISFSSQRDSEGYGAHQLVGPPRIFPMHGHSILGAWQPAVMEGAGGPKTEWVELRFGTPMYISGIEIYETFLAGACTSVALWAAEPAGETQAGRWDVVWQGEPRQERLPSEARLFSPPLTTRPYASRFVRIELRVAAAADSGKVLAAQIDAVRLIGLKAPEDSVDRSPQKTRGAGDRAGKGSSSTASSQGPRFRRAEDSLRRAEEQLRSQREGHEREVRNLRSYVDHLRGYGEALRTELDAKTSELSRVQEALGQARNA